MEIGLLASGSKGNATLVRSNGTAFLVDAGLSAKELQKRLATYGLAPSDLLGIVLTHEHIDHIRGAGTLARRYDLPVWSNLPTRTASEAHLGGLPEWHEIQIGLPFQIGSLRLNPFSTPHDAADPFGLILESETGYRIGLGTDLGFVTRLVRERLRGVQGLVLEFNHDLDLLLSGPYPWPIKQRIRGKLGHLENTAAAQLLREIMPGELEWLVCAHLSEMNNSSQIVMECAREGLSGREVAGRKNPPPIFVAAQSQPTPLFGPEMYGKCNGVPSREGSS